MDETRRAKLAALKAQRAAIDEQIMALAMELAADDIGLEGRERELFVRGSLTNADPSRIVSIMNVDDTGQTSAVKRAIARGRRNHPAQVILYEAGVTITDLAAELKETRQRVSAWMSDKPKDLRGIPRRHVDYLKRKYKIPASAWARIDD